ncbi:hypothetical protein [Roseivivax sp. THAF197b]|uniref:hypothetical protein n=1 Tax=Roseivivax sp. THAF197b TaxID=2588299 RepID=UPI001268B05F|nr:hypothetical protein [Roseivivax sp. THAF197b]QFS83019.1 hypothetical protein FIV09_09305 [Roseivivax sp. THAF197b]
MLVPAPSIPLNLKQKLTSAAARFLQNYDDMTLREIRDMLKRHDFRMPVLGRFAFHKNGALKEIKISSNLKGKKPKSNEFAATVTFASSPWHATNELWAPCLNWIVEEEAKTPNYAGLLNPSRVSEDELTVLTRKLPKHSRKLNLGADYASGLMLRILAEREEKIRANESAHERIERTARPLPKKIMDNLEVERAAALRWAETQKAAGHLLGLNSGYQFLAEDDQIILRFRTVCYENDAK